MLMVIGASGRVGRLMQAVQEPGEPVLWWSRSDAAQGQAPAGLPRGGAPSLAEALAQRPRAVLLLSAVTAGSPAELEENSRIAADFAAELAAAQIPLVLFASSQAVYGETAPGGAAEPDAPRYPSLYGRAKAGAEAAFLAGLGGGQSRGMILRLGNVAGADQLAASVASGAELRLDRFPGGSGPVRSYLTPEDLLRLLRGLPEVAERGADLPPVLNVSGEAPLPMAEILRAAGRTFRWQDAPPSAWREVAMTTGLLRRFCPALAPRSGVPEVAAWLSARSAL